MQRYYDIVNFPLSLCAIVPLRLFITFASNYKSVQWIQ
jgi:hypothetical protein